MHDLKSTVDAVMDRVVGSPHRRAYSVDAGALPAIGEAPVTAAEWDDLLQHIAVTSHNPRHPGWSAHMSGTPALIGVGASLFVDALGNNMLAEAQAPSAYAAKLELERWISGLLGWESPGMLAAYESGSLSNLHAMVEARNRALATGMFRDRVDLLKSGVVIGSALAHQSVAKAMDVVGFDDTNFVSIPTDEHGGLSVSELRAAQQRIARDGRSVFLVVLTLGTTSLGSVDPIDDAVAAVAGDPWIHVDGAFGGGLIFGRRHRLRLRSLSAIRSFAVNPHKLLNTPCGCALLLLEGSARYFSHPFTYAGPQTGTRPNSEWMLSGSGRASLLALYLMVRGAGAESLADHVDAHMDRALEFAAAIGPMGYDVLTRPRTPVVIFRPSWSAGDVLAMSRDLESDGLYLSTTELDGAVWFRSVWMNTSIDMDSVLRLLRERSPA